MPNDAITVEISGLEDVEKTLTDTTRKVAAKYLRKAMKAGTQIIQDRIEQSAPVDTGFLSEHIKVAIDTKGDSASMTAHIGPAPQAYYGMFEEFGANGRPGLHFMEQAAIDTRDEVIQTFADTARNSLDDLKQASFKAEVEGA
jgi:HK97 gp10 family phage protein